MIFHGTERKLEIIEDLLCAQDHVRLLLVFPYTNLLGRYSFPTWELKNLKPTIAE